MRLLLGSLGLMLASLLLFMGGLRECDRADCGVAGDVWFALAQTLAPVVLLLALGGLIFAAVRGLSRARQRLRSRPAERVGELGEDR